MIVGGNPATWEDANKVAALRKLHSQGQSASDMAQVLSQEFKDTITRNSVLGKLHRLGLKATEKGKEEHSRRVSKGKREKRCQRPRAAASAVVKRVTVKAIATEYNSQDLGDGVDMNQLTSETCKWPLGGVLDHPPYKYCGRRTGGKPYCPHHARMSKRKFE